MNTQIEISNLTHIFGTHTVLEDINLIISESDFISVVGPNGGGKSSLFKLILGLVIPSKGIITIEGKAPQSQNSMCFGYVPQIKTSDRSFPALSIELVASGLTSNWSARLNKDVRDKSLEALEEVKGTHLAFRPVSKLSGGELQRIYLARCIVRKPKILLLDEPSTGIDSSSEGDLNKILEDIRNKSSTTVIMATHDWESAYHHSDKVILLNKTVVCFDEPEKAFNEESLRITFGHIGHKHDIIFGARHSHE